MCTYSSLSSPATYQFFLAIFLLNYRTFHFDALSSYPYFGAQKYFHFSLERSVTFTESCSLYQLQYFQHFRLPSNGFWPTSTKHCLAGKYMTFSLLFRSGCDAVFSSSLGTIMKTAFSYYKSLIDL